MTSTMTSIPHLWNISKFFEKMQNPEVAKLRMHYVQCCREVGDEIDLPKQNFGPAIFCPHCGISWATTQHKTRISPRTSPPQHIQNLMRMSRSSGSRLPKYRHTLMGKCEKNKTNKMIKICSVCSNSAKFSLSKPERRKLPKINTLNDSNLLSSKKKKKRSRDKTAGLHLSATNTPEPNQTKNLLQEKSHTPLLLINNKRNLNPNTPVSVSSKPQKMNLTKLKGLMNTNFTPSKKSKLHSFLQEL